VEVIKRRLHIQCALRAALYDSLAPFGSVMASPGEPVDIDRFQLVLVEYLVVRLGILVKDRELDLGPIADLVDFELGAHVYTFAFHSPYVKLDPC
jgi:hypothetical protein